MSSPTAVLRCLVVPNGNAEAFEASRDGGAATAGGHRVAVRDRDVALCGDPLVPCSRSLGNSFVSGDEILHVSSEGIVHAQLMLATTNTRR